MPIDRHLLNQSLAHFEARALDVSVSPTAFYATSVALRFGDARAVEAMVAMARLTRELARQSDLSA